MCNNIKKSLLITLDFPPNLGGVSTYYYNIFKNLPADKVVVLAPNQKGDDEFDIKQHFPILRKKMNFLPSAKSVLPTVSKMTSRIRWIAGIKHFSTISKQHKIELIQVGQVLPLGTLAMLFEKQSKIPYIFYTHGLDIVLPQKNPRKKAILKKIIKNAKGIVANSYFTKDELVNLGADEKKIVVVYPCPNYRGEHIEIENINLFKERYNLNDKKILLSVGRLIKRKGFDMAIKALPEIISDSPIPVIADIHFDHRLALGAISAGIHGVRINPGNIGSDEKVKEVAEAAGRADVTIRVGANSGSLPEGRLENELAPGTLPREAMARALVKSALQQCRLLEQFGFDQIKVSLKSPDVPIMTSAYREFAEASDYPLHLGVTEAGTLTRGTIKSSIGIGALLLDGIGDTLRVSLTADPVEEIKVAQLILETVGLRIPHPEIISCPTCGRTEFDLLSLVEKVEKEIAEIKNSGIKLKIKKVAVMGCVVNGPGEAKDAELGIAGVKGGKASVFLHGESVGTFSEEESLKIFREKLLEFK